MNRIRAADAWAQEKAHSEILSKEDARRVFAMSRSQWTDHVRALVRAGQAQAVGDVEGGLRAVTQTPDGDILYVHPDYFEGDAKPAVIHVNVAYRPPRARLLTDEAIRTVILAAKREMAPEFHVIGHWERTTEGLAVLFSIMEPYP